jgi:DNA mismatch endonuclease (patch repair protein)
MTDKISTDRRSANMSAIRSQDMKPELRVRHAVHKAGYRYRLHRSDLPGKPDLVFVGRHKVIFVHGCFWHQHRGCIDGHKPQSNQSYWIPKLKRNKNRDKASRAQLTKMGWHSLVIWECWTNDQGRLKKLIRKFLS